MFHDPSDITQIQIKSPLLITELEDALQNWKSKIPSPDGIPSLFIHNLPNNANIYLLSIYNSLWNNKTFCLLNTICKLLEKIINNRLIWFLKKYNYFTPEQNGFRSNRSTTKNLLNITIKFKWYYATNKN